MVYGNFEGRIKFKTSETLDGGRFSGVPWVSGLINGKGRYFNPTTSKKFSTLSFNIFVNGFFTYNEVLSIMGFSFLN